MKKVILGFAIAGLLATNAFAVDDAGTAFPVGRITMVDCSLLTEEVKVNLSANVFGAYACNTTSNVIGVATCHPNGRKGTVSVSCDPVGDPDADPAVPADENCTASTDDPTSGTTSVQGGIAYRASSAGGRVSGTAAVNCAMGGDTTSEAATAAGL